MGCPLKNLRRPSCPGGPSRKATPARKHQCRTRRPSPGGTIEVSPQWILRKSLFPESEIKAGLVGITLCLFLMLRVFVYRCADHHVPRYHFAGWSSVYSQQRCFREKVVTGNHGTRLCVHRL